MAEVKTEVKKPEKLDKKALIARKLKDINNMSNRAQAKFLKERLLNK